MSIFCEECEGETRVTESRVSGLTMRRRRVCLECGHRYTTYEITISRKVKYDAAMMKLHRIETILGEKQ